MAVPSILKDNLSIPVIGSPLFIISNPDLVIAQCKAGVIGSFPALNARPEPVLEEWLDRITSELKDHDKNNPDNKAAPFAVNQIVHGSNARLKHDMDMCEKYEVPVIITSLGAKQWVNDQVHGWGGIVLHDIINNRFAKSAISKGADGLIAVAAGAGGHAGQLSPFALIQEIREWFDGPLLLSGSMATGDSSSRRKRWVLIWATSAQLSSPPKRPTRTRATSKPSLTAGLTISSTAISLPVFTATT